MFLVLFRRLVSIVLRRKMFAMGNAIAIGLRKGLVDAGVPVFYEHELADLLLEGGRVVGVVVEHDGDPPRGARPARRDPGQRRIRAERSSCASEVPPPAHVGGVVHRLRLQHRRRARGRHRGRRGDRPHGRRLVGPHDPAAERPLVLSRRAQPARLAHGQPGRPAVHERGAAVRRGRAGDVQGRADRRRPRAELDDHRPALPQPLPLRRAQPAAAVPRPLVQERHDQEGVDARGARRGDRRTGRRADGHRHPVQRLRGRGGRRGLPPGRVGLRQVLLGPHREAEPLVARDRSGARSTP